MTKELTQKDLAVTMYIMLLLLNQYNLPWDNWENVGVTFHYVTHSNEAKWFNK